MLIWKKSDAAATKKILLELAEVIGKLDAADLSKDGLEATIKNFIADQAYDNGSVLWPLRTALTGQEKSPGPFEVADTLALGLGKEEIIKRLQNAISKL